MSLLDELPDRCTIQRRVRVKDSLGGSKDGFVVEQTDVECWEQQAGAAESAEFEKKGITVTSKVYFVENPKLTSRHQIVVTSRNGVVIDAADQAVLDVAAAPLPDVSVGRGLLWRVMVGFKEGE